MGGYFSANNNVPEESETDDEDYIAAPAVTHGHHVVTSTEHKRTMMDSTIIIRPLSDSAIPLSKVHKIEDFLDFYEKVSLVYLLYDNADIALQYLMQVHQGAQLNVLVEWARSMKMIKWESMLLEALSIIQNYQVIAMLGYDEREVREHFLPSNRNTSIFVNLIRKKLYLIFDGFDETQITTFLSIVRKDFHMNNMIFRSFPSENLLEMYLLHWTTINYMSLNNLDNLYRAFKVMELYDEVDYLKSENGTAHVKKNRPVPIINANIVSSKIQDMNIATSSNSNIYYKLSESNVPDTVLEYQPSNRLPNPSKRHPTSNCYEVNPNCPGICLIINQVHFYVEPDPALRHLTTSLAKHLEPRYGSDKDRDQLQSTFEKYGYNVMVANDRTHNEVVEEIKAALFTMKEHSSVIVIILSHGVQGKVYGINSIPIDVKYIQRIICRTNVAHVKGKPKILILQSCQGTKCQQVLPDDCEDSDLQSIDLHLDGPGGAVPRTADLLVFWATVPGFGAVRDTKNGSWFIQALCKAIIENAKFMHFSDICTMVKKEVTEKRWVTEGEVRTMVPILESTFSSFFYLPSVTV